MEREDVVQDLLELKKIGVRVPAKALEMARTADLSEYANMTVVELADMLIMQSL